MAKAAINTDFTYEAMTQTWEENRTFFQRNEAEFMKKYPGQYVAVHDGEVLLTGMELGPLAGEIYEKYGNIPFYAHVPGEERVEATAILRISRQYRYGYIGMTTFCSSKLSRYFAWFR